MGHFDCRPDAGPESENQFMKLIVRPSLRHRLPATLLGLLLAFPLAGAVNATEDATLRLVDHSVHGAQDVPERVRELEGLRRMPRCSGLPSQLFRGHASCTIGTPRDLE